MCLLFCRWPSDEVPPDLLQQQQGQQVDMPLQQQQQQQEMQREVQQQQQQQYGLISPPKPPGIDRRLRYWTRKQVNSNTNPTSIRV